MHIFAGGQPNRILHMMLFQFIGTWNVIEVAKLLPTMPMAQHFFPFIVSLNAECHQRDNNNNNNLFYSNHTTYNINVHEKNETFSNTSAKAR